MLTIIESGSRAWALATTNGDLRIYTRDEPQEWTEVFLSDDSQQLDENGSLILEALYEQRIAPTRDETEEEPELEEEQPEAEQDEDPEAEHDEAAEEEQAQPRRARAKTRARTR